MQTYPLVIVRHDQYINDYPEVMAALLEIARRHPGSLDEIWVADGSFDEGEALRARLEKLCRFRPMCEKAGVRFSFQQGITIGHGAVKDVAQAPSGAARFPEDAWQVGRDGARLYGLLCPRSPAAQAHLRNYVRQVLETLRPVSYWLDDDLRMGICKDDGCFCDRCLSEFNQANRLDLTRGELVARLYGEAETDPLRELWSEFNENSLVAFVRQARQAADDIHSDCRLSLQTVWANSIYTARGYPPVLRALSGEGRHPVGIRPGASVYHEDMPHNIIVKSLSVMREAARFRRSGLEGTVCNEEENYPRKVLRKSSEAIMIESALMLASGCDAMSLYRYSAWNPEPLDCYEEFAAMVSAYRPYCEMLSAASLRTRLGGIARYLGEHCNGHRDFSLDDPAELPLAQVGIPLTVAEAAPSAWLVTRKTVRESTEGDFRRIFAGAAVFTEDAFDAFLAGGAGDSLLPRARELREAYREALAQGASATLAEDGVRFAPYETECGIPSKLLHTGWACMKTPAGGRIAVVQPVATDFLRPSVMRRRSWLDAMDFVCGGLPVRLETCHRIRLLPRLDGSGKVDNVTLLNCGIGETVPPVLFVRGPKTETPRWWRPRAEPLPLPMEWDAEHETARLVLPPLPGWQLGTLLFE